MALADCSIPDIKYNVEIFAIVIEINIFLLTQHNSNIRTKNKRFAENKTKQKLTKYRAKN